MYRVSNGFLLKGKRSDDWTVTIRQLGNGHAEASARRAIVWEEVAELTPEALAMKLEADAKDEADREERNRERAARRAKTQVRQRIKAAGLDALLTLTYKANITDLERCKADFKAFVRRMRRLLPGFTYVAAFETQRRGCWHVHMAVHRLPKELPASNGVKVKSFNVVRAVWRLVTGEAGGNIDVQRRKRTTQQSAGKLAAYLSKYMLKAWEDGDKWSNRYSASQGITIPPALVLEFREVALRELVGLIYDEIGQGRCDCMSWLAPYGDTFFLSTERPPPLAR